VAYRRSESLSYKQFVVKYMRNWGVKVAKPELLYKEFDSKEQRERFVFYATIGIRRQNIVLGEGQAFQFVGLGDYTNLSLGPYTKKYLKKFVETQKKNYEKYTHF